MTKKEYIDNFNLDEKLKKIQELKNMDFYDFLEGPFRDWLIEKYSDDEQMIRDFKIFIALENQKRTESLDEEEQYYYDFYLYIYQEHYKDYIKRLEQEVEQFVDSLKYFCEIPDLPFLKWLNYYENMLLYVVPLEEYTTKQRQNRLLMVEVLRGNLTLEEYNKKLWNEPEETYLAESQIKMVYDEYLKTQITRPFIEFNMGSNYGSAIIQKFKNEKKLKYK